MSSAPFMQLYPADYLSDTLDLTTEQHGAYLLILMTMWQHDAKLPSDPAKLARIARMTPAKFKAVWSEISRFFTVDGGIITNARLLKEHKKARKKSEARAIAGKAGGHAKAMKDKASASGNCHADAMASSSETRIKKEEANASLSSDDDQSLDAHPIDEIAEAVSAYNVSAEAAGWPRVRALSKQRRASLRARLRDCGGLTGWDAALARARASPLCCGQNNRGWTASFDFLTSQSGFTKLMEGNYDDRQSPQQNRQSAADDRFGRIADAAVRNRAPSRPDFGFG